MLIIKGKQISEYRVKVLRSMLELEIKGMTRSRGPSGYKLIKQEFGLKGNKQKVLDQLNAIIEGDLK